MGNQILQDVESMLVGASIQWIKRTCNLIMFNFTKAESEDIALHVASFLRITKDGRTIVCSNDMFFPGKKAKKRRFRWDEPYMSLFDDSIELHQSDLIGQTINHCNIINNELHLFLQNDVELQVIPDSVEEGEAYRLFTQSKELYVCDCP